MGSKMFFALAIVLLMLGLSVSVSNPVAATLQRIAGVRVGDSADYEVYIHYHPNVDRFRLLVTDVQLSKVSFTLTYYHANGSIYETEAYNLVDVMYPDGNFAVMFLIAGYLYKGDIYYTTNNHDCRINATVTRHVAGSIRTANYVPILYFTYPYGMDQPVGVDMYWDRETGLTIEGHLATMAGWFNWTMTSTSLGTGSHVNDPIAYYVLSVSVVFVLALIAVIAALTKRR